MARITRGETIMKKNIHATRNNTQSKKARENSDEEIKKLAIITKQSPLLVLVTDKAGVITYVNNQFTKVTGYSRKEALGNTPRLLKSGHTGKDVYADLWGTITKKKIWHGELQNKRRDGSFYWVSVSISPILDAKGAVTGFISMQQDISKQKQHEEELKTFNEFAIDRELHMIELKKEINDLRVALKMKPKYDI